MPKITAPNGSTWDRVDQNEMHNQEFVQYRWKNSRSGAEVIITKYQPYGDEWHYTGYFPDDDRIDYYSLDRAHDKATTWMEYNPQEDGSYE